MGKRQKVVFNTIIFKVIKILGVKMSPKKILMIVGDFVEDL